MADKDPADETSQTQQQSIGEEIEESELGFPVVGIGASAGGLEALEQLVGATVGDGAPETGMALVLVQHLDPNHDSILADLLSRRTNLRVRQVEDGDRLEPDTLFVIPPGSGLEVDGVRLKLVAFEEPRGVRRPIDDFFVSLADACGPACAGVVVSGTGSDRAMGLRAVKEAGGLVVVQEPADARYDGMPTAALATGLADRSLPASGILSFLQNYFDDGPRRNASGVEDDVLEYLDDITDLLARATGHDFGGYKHSTLVRRIRRRMQVVGVSDAAGYLAVVERVSGEAQALLSDILINVTRFFRDPDVWDEVEERIVPELLRDRPGTDAVRVWVPGCSSGEEAYTLAMIFARAVEGRDDPPPVHVFATDIDAAMLETAKAGRYPLACLDDIPERFRNCCTVEATGQFLVAPHVRDTVRFSLHSLIKDPPFSRLDMVSCRNLLIYFNARLQRAVMPVFHHSLRPDGVLLLGPAETVGRRDDLFREVDRPARIYRRVAGRTPEILTLPIGGGAARGLPAMEVSPERPRPASGVRVPLPRDAAATRDFARARLLDGYAPTHLVVAESGEIVESSGRLSRYFDFPPGGMTADAAALARPGLRDALRRALRVVRDGGDRQVVRDLEVRSEFGVQSADLAVDPLPDGTALVVLRSVEDFRAATDGDVVPEPDMDAARESLEAELDQTRHRLRSTVEELETANEELKSSNEEMMSMNEELQSANEELTTVNDELKGKIDKLAQLNDDQRNFLASTELALVVVDRSCNVRMFTDAATDIFPLSPGDVGRPLGDFQSTLSDVDILRSAREVLRSGEEVARTVTTRDGGRSYAMRLLPYRLADGTVDGASLTWTETTKLRDARQVAEDSSQRLELALAVTQVGVWEASVDTGEAVLDPVVRAMFGLEGHKGLLTADQVISQVDERDRATVDAKFAEAIETGGEFRDEFRIGGTEPVRWLSGIGRVVDAPDGSKRILGVNYDITELKEAERAQELLVRELDHRVKNLFSVVLGMLRAEARQTTNTVDLVAHVEARLSALSRAHEASRGGGDADYSTVPLRTLVERVLDPYGVGSRVEVDGPAVDLSVNSTTPVGLVLHELATNAQKYGALSKDGGKVKVSWKRTDSGGGGVDLRWTESGGPEVREPERPGFGMRLVRQSVQQIGGHMELLWEPEGLRFSAALPIRDRASPQAP